MKNCVRLSDSLGAVMQNSCLQELDIYSTTVFVLKDCTSCVSESEFFHRIKVFVLCIQTLTYSGRVK